MARYSPEFVARVQRDYEDTDISIPALAAKYETYVRTIQRWAAERGWKRRSERPPRELPNAVRLLDEATALVAERGTADANIKEPPTPDPSPPLATLAGGGEFAAIERIERLVEQELAAEEAVRAQLGSLPRNAADAQRCARTLATLTQTLQTLQRLRCGLAPNDDHHDDDMPEDIDEFRNELARRIEAFIASRPDEGVAAGDRRPASGGETGA